MLYHTTLLLTRPPLLYPAHHPPPPRVHRARPHDPTKLRSARDRLARAAEHRTAARRKVLHECREAAGHVSCIVGQHVRRDVQVARRRPRERAAPLRELRARPLQRAVQPPRLPCPVHLPRRRRATVHRSGARRPEPGLQRKRRDGTLYEPLDDVDVDEARSQVRVHVEDVVLRRRGSVRVVVQVRRALALWSCHINLRVREASLWEKAYRI